MYLILPTIARALATDAISTTPDGGMHRESLCTQTKLAHTHRNMLREVKVQIARWPRGGPPILHTSVNQPEDLGLSRRGQASQD